MRIETLEDIELLAESIEMECKAAQGRDGKGELPDSFWESYSAMANTQGGVILLGIKEEKDHSFKVVGIQNISRVQKSLWDNLNNKQIVNRNVLQVSDVDILTIDNKQILQIQIPKAKREHQPVHPGENPLTGTYIRRHESDYKAEDEIVKRMMVESINDSRDDHILENFQIKDLDLESVQSYRYRFSAVKKDHPFLDLSFEDFLSSIGAIGINRETGKSGLRVAGLLMFGRYNTIKEVFPNYMVDFQERPEAKTELRWIDRIIPDGTWSGNLYDFYQKVIRKLTADLKVPFHLESETRVDDTPVHIALREALTNTLIHADYTAKVSILVVRRPDMFGFRNPGLMRVSLKQALTGGISDCRNHRIQDMFRYIGPGEHAGSGIPGILRSWNKQHWCTPLLYENRENESTLLELRTSSLLPEASIERLAKILGSKFDELSELKRIILVTADAEGNVSHSRLRSLSSDHPKDISNDIASLVKEGLLDKEGSTRDAIYYLTGELYQPDMNSIQSDFGLNSPDSDSNSPDLKAILSKIGYESMPKKLARNKMQEIIKELCFEQFLSLKELANILERDSKTVQDEYLTHMLAKGILQLKYPDTRNHPKQAYIYKKP